ncbi:S8 family serine peptidase [Marmoricola sp. RAF53]|uniref:S8 family serine peptidase n=1 Tax=Marmoricola sp. RAF53 TaxID=3233059 RepID=UPI003F9540B5
MTGPAGNKVSLGGHVVDPLVEQDKQLGKNDPIDPERRPAWIVQFVARLDQAAITELRTEYGVRLTDYVPPRSYIESLSPAVASRLRRDDRVRAVSLMGGDLKLSAELNAAHESNDPEDPAPVDVVIFAALADDVVAQIRSFVPADRVIGTLDDRGLGGAFVLRLLIRSGVAARIAEIDGVRWVEAVPPTIDDGGAAGGDQDAPSDPPSTSRIEVADRLGLDGAGQIIGVIDNGPLDIAHCFFADPAYAVPGPGHRKVVQLRNVANSPAGKHATFTSGILAGDQGDHPGKNEFRGVAYGARLACGNKNDIDATSSLLAELSAAADAGAFVHSNSWHSAPQGAGNPAAYDQRSADLDRFAWTHEDHVVLGSSGNDGEEQGPPGTAKNAICVSAVELGGGTEDAVKDGNPGPTADGRRKPDVLGIGCGVVSATVGTACGTGNGNVRCSSSRATPWVAGVLTLVRQQLTEGRQRDGEPHPADAFAVTGAMLRAIAVDSAIAGADTRTPSLARGWGLVDPSAALGQRTPRLLLDVRHENGLATTDTCRVTFGLEEPGRLAVSLTWSEPPGAVGSDNSVVNDLDLRLTSPSGKAFLGNTVAAGRTPPGGSADRLNSTEVILVAPAETGEWVVEVVGTEVNVGNPKQGFAVVVSGALAPGGTVTPSAGRTLRRTDPVPVSGDPG